MAKFVETIVHFDFLTGIRFEKVVKVKVNKKILPLTADIKLKINEFLL